MFLLVSAQLGIMTLQEMDTDTESTKAQDYLFDHQSGIFLVERNVIDFFVILKYTLNLNTLLISVF